MVPRVNNHINKITYGFASLPRKLDFIFKKRWASGRCSAKLWITLSRGLIQ